VKEMEKINILLVDDRPEQILVLEKILKSPELSIHNASSANIALALLLEHDFALVILDVEMPERDAFEIAGQIRANAVTEQIPIIFMTVISKEQKYLVKGSETGAVDYLFKPLNPVIVKSKVKLCTDLYRQKRINKKLARKLESSLAKIEVLTDHLEQIEDKHTAEHQDTLEELKKTQAQMIQAEKMVSIGQLAAGVAHEINNPCSFVSSNLNTLSEYIADLTKIIPEYRRLIADAIGSIAKDGTTGITQEQVEHIRDMEEELDLDFLLDDVTGMVKETQEGAERIKHIVLDLKNFAHPGEDTPQAVDINKCLESALNIVWNELKYKITVTKEYGDLPQLKCYPQQLNQILVNLLVNAGQAIKDKGEIRIGTRAVNGDIEIRIADTGEGIPKENLSRIFDPFFTTKPVGKGTGLGLNVVYGIIHKHGGTIDIETEVGKGTTFIIKLPKESCWEDTEKDMV